MVSSPPIVNQIQQHLRPRTLTVSNKVSSLVNGEQRKNPKKLDLGDYRSKRRLAFFQEGT